MRERIIYRPNAIPAAEWEALSREEQIRWWTEREPPPGPPPDPLKELLKEVHRYRRGVLRDSDFISGVFPQLTEQVVREFVEQCPPDLLQILQATSDSLPPETDTVAWGEMVSVGGFCFAPWVTPEDIQRIQVERTQRFRRGLRAFREFQDEHRRAAE